MPRATRGQLKQAVLHYEAAASETPDDPTLFVQLGNCYKDLGRFRPG